MRLSHRISALAVLLLLGGLGFRRPWRTAPRSDLLERSVRGLVLAEPMSLPVAAVIGVFAAVVVGLAFRPASRRGGRSGRRARPLARHWRASARAHGRHGARDRRTAIYLLHPPEDLGGFNSNYSVDLIAAHWVAVLVVLLALVAGLKRATSFPSVQARRKGARRSLGRRPS